MATKYSLKELFYWWALLALCFGIFSQFTESWTAGIAAFGLLLGTVFCNKLLNKAASLVFAVVCSVGLIIAEGFLDQTPSGLEFSFLIATGVPIGVAGGTIVWIIALVAERAFHWLYGR